MATLDFVKRGVSRISSGEIVLNKRMSEREFVAWWDKEVGRAEWEDGKVVIMSPVSSTEDDINNWLIAVLRLFVEAKDLGVIKGPSFMVRLAEQRRRRVPDVLFISKAREDLLKKNHLEGAPDAAFEIVSVDSQTRDRRKKFEEYQEAGVEEYWIIDPLTETMEVYRLKRGAFVAVEEENAAFRSATLPGFYLKPAWLWRKPMPKLMTIAKELGI